MGCVSGEFFQKCLVVGIVTGTQLEELCVLIVGVRFFMVTEMRTLKLGVVIDVDDALICWKTLNSGLQCIVECQGEVVDGDPLLDCKMYRFFGIP